MEKLKADDIGCRKLGGEFGVPGRIGDIAHEVEAARARLVLLEGREQLRDGAIAQGLAPETLHVRFRDRDDQQAQIGRLGGLAVDRAMVEGRFQALPSAEVLRADDQVRDGEADRDCHLRHDGLPARGGVQKRPSLLLYGGERTLRYGRLALATCRDGDGDRAVRVRFYPCARSVRPIPS